MRTLQPGETLESLFRGTEEGVIFVYFTALWCGPCSRISPVCQSYSERENNVVFVKVDVDEHQTLCDKYNINTIPTIQVLVGGNPIREPVPVASEDTIRELIAQHRP